MNVTPAQQRDVIVITGGTGFIGTAVVLGLTWARTRRLISGPNRAGEAKQAQKRYSPSQFISADKRRIAGNPDFKEVSTSHVERQNLTMRMGMRRFTRLTNGFSKKIENLEHSVALHFMHYNFGRIHKSLRVTPAMEAGISDHVWGLEEIAALVPESVAKKRGNYKKTK